MINYQVGHYYKRTYDDHYWIIFVVKTIDKKNMMVDVLKSNKKNEDKRLAYIFTDYRIDDTFEIDEAKITAVVL